MTKIFKPNCKYLHNFRETGALQFKNEKVEINPLFTLRKYNHTAIAMAFHFTLAHTPQCPEN